MMSNNNIMKRAELAFVPAPGVGHLLCTVQLAKLLLQTNPSIYISIYVIDLPMSSAQLTAYVDSQSRDNPDPTRLIFFTFPTISNHPDQSLTHFFSILIDLHKPLIKQAVEDRVKSGLPRPAGFVLDMFCTTMVDIANELHIPSYLFLPVGAGSVSPLFYAQALADDHGLEARDLAKKFSDSPCTFLVPGFKNPLTSGNIPPSFQDQEGACEMLLSLTRKFRGTKGILLNTYMELEPFAVHALHNSDDKSIPPVYPVGPLVEVQNINGGKSDDKEEKESIVKWLDSQPESSVVFLCFGSVVCFRDEQVQEIANGLEKSGCRYLWALRKPPQKEVAGAPSDDKAYLEALPEGFLNRTSYRGKVIGWAPQVKILSHPSVGGFVSHCGWNSVLESLWFGVPIAAWPMYSEQQLNAFELVKELNLAVEIRLDYKIGWKSHEAEFLVSASEIEQGLKKLMNMDEKMKGNVEEMSEKGKKALEKGGSSYQWLDRFVEDVFRNIP